jgi:lysophospholipase L1-like esterase
MATGDPRPAGRPGPARWTRRGALLLAVSGVAGAAVLTRPDRRSPAPADAMQETAATVPVRGFRPREIVVFGHSWAAGVHVRRSRSWPSLMADRLRSPRPRVRSSNPARMTNFTWGGSRATGTAEEHGAGFVLQTLTAGPATAPDVILLLTGDLDISRHGQSPASRRLMGGGIDAALGRFLATEVHEEDDAAAWAYGPGWSTDRGSSVNSGRGAAYSVQDGATFTVRLPADYDGAPVTVGLPLWDRTVGGTITWRIDGRPLDRRTDLEALRAVLTREYPSAAYAERFTGLSAGAHELQGTWRRGERGSAVVVDYWSTERRGVPIVCVLMPANNPWGNTFGAITTTSNQANREALAGRRGVHYVDLQRAVNPTGTRRDRRYWDSDESSHPTAAGERAIAAAVARAVARLRPA